MSHKVKKFDPDPLVFAVQFWDTLLELYQSLWHQKTRFLGPVRHCFRNAYVLPFWYNTETDEHRDRPTNGQIQGHSHSISVGCFLRLPWIKELSLEWACAVLFGGDFQGKNLRRGVRISDYRITIGNGECNISSLSDNTLNCRPPYVEPEMSPDNKCGYLYKTILVRDISADCISAWQIMYTFLSVAANVLI